jgi:2-oxo-4-hydroxy-4-carboxy-5-ureidoimidazoline decarboxylase
VEEAMTVDAFNALPDEEAEARLRACLPVGRWVETVRNGRPYAGWPALEGAARGAAGELSDDELARALAGHPRIGERASGPDHEPELSRREQSGVDASDGEVARALAEGNAAYEKRFDRVFLIRAAGRSAGEILEELTRRLGNDDATEREETVTQLREIALLRLRQVVS